jgi:predicted alpha/beta superfamily hydrolase
LIPHVDATYRTNTTAPRTLIGHSLAGLYSLYSVTRAGNPFARVIAASASYPFENGEIFAQEAALFARTQQLPVRLFASVGEIEGAPQHVYFEAFVERLRSRQYVGFELNDHSIASADHLDTIDPSVELGLTWLLGDAP